MNSPLFPSYWGFSFALGCGVSPHSRSSAYHLTGVSLNLDMGYLLMTAPVKAQPLLLTLDIGYLLMAAPGPITSWQIDGETVETVTDFIFGDSKITADGDCSHEIKRHLLLGRKVITNLDSIFKNRDITLPTKVPLVKAMVFQVVMYGCKSRTIKKAEG